MSERRRADIDGLRCVAVTSVLLYHLDEQLLPAGFLGVDVFFVISGYVVCHSIVKGDKPLDASAVFGFYVRRMRRLFPALFATIALTVVAYSLFVPPRTTSELLGVVPFSLVGLGNFWLLARGFDYFGFDIEQNPLMHTWSLGVEEQFYLLFPLLFLATRTRGRRIDPHRATIGVGVVFGLSLLSFVVLAERSPLVAYLATPTRLWEIAAGALLCLTEPRLVAWLPVSTWSESKRSALSACCFLLLLLSFFGTDEFNQIPVGLTAIAVGLTVALILFRSSLADRTYGHPILARVGVMSYVIYLVHWPVLCFYRWIGGHFGLATLVPLAVIVVLTLCLHRWIERIWQGRQANHRTVVGLSAAMIVLLILATGTATTRAMYLGRTALDAEPPDRWWPTGGGRTAFGCHRTRYDERQLEDCLSSPPGRRRIVVAGDSHAGNWTPMTLAAAQAHQLGHASATIGSGCAVMPSSMITDRLQRDTDCLLYNRFLREELIPTFQEGDILVFGISREKVTKNNHAQFTGFLRGLATQLQGQGAHLVLLDDVPRLETQPERCVPHWWSTPPAACKFDGTKDLRIRGPLSRGLRAVRADNVTYLDPWPLLCPEPIEKCLPWMREDQLAYVDRDHISVQTSVAAMDWFVDGALGPLLEHADSGPR